MSGCADERNRCQKHERGHDEATHDGRRNAIAPTCRALRFRRSRRTARRLDASLPIEAFNRLNLLQSILHTGTYVVAACNDAKLRCNNKKRAVPAENLKIDALNHWCQRSLNNPPYDVDRD